MRRKCSHISFIWQELSSHWAQFVFRFLFYYLTMLLTEMLKQRGLTMQMEAISRSFGCTWNKLNQRHFKGKWKEEEWLNIWRDDFKLLSGIVCVSLCLTGWGIISKCTVHVEEFMWYLVLVQIWALCMSVVCKHVFFSLYSNTNNKNLWMRDFLVFFGWSNIITGEKKALKIDCSYPFSLTHSLTVILWGWRLTLVFCKKWGLLMLNVVLKQEYISAGGRQICSTALTTSCPM